MPKLISTLLGKKAIFGYVLTAVLSGIVAAAINTKNKVVDGEFVEVTEDEHMVGIPTENTPEFETPPVATTKVTKKTTVSTTKVDSEQQNEPAVIE